MGPCPSQNSADDHHPFLDMQGHRPSALQDDDPEKEGRLQKTKTRKTSWINIAPWCLSSVLFILVLYLERRPGSSGCAILNRECDQSLLYSPAQNVIEYEVRKFRLGLDGDETEFQGNPSPELDKRWNDLYEMGINLIPKDMAAQLPNKTIIFPHDEERRYLIELDVFHQLHCLNMVRKALHPEYYHPHIPGPHAGDEDELLGPHHIDHCVDAIRQSLMCNADISALTWSWDEHRQQHMERGTVLHTCKRFDKIQEWARAHEVRIPFDSTYRERNDPLDPDTWE